MADNLPTSSASFDSIKQDLINFFKSQAEFKDYDFTASRLNVLCDGLAYATLYQQQYANAAKFESHMRTAATRSSVVQHAQDMGYDPSSIRASQMDVRIEGIHSLNPPVVEIPSGTRFVAKVPGDVPYDFVNWDKVQMLRGTDNKYSARVKLVQGVIGQYEVLYRDGASIIIRDKDFDRDYIRVFVNEAEWTNWSKKSIVNTTGGSTVYYVRETVDGSTEVYFGEGTAQEYTEEGGAYNPSYIGGLKPIDGQRIRIEFLKTSGVEANGSTNVAFADSISGFDITTLEENPDNDADYTGSQGGGEPEDINRIRSLAPIFRESQRRCVTKLDYETFVSQRFANFVQAIQCYGDSSKPGYAFIAIKPKNGLSLTTTQKEDIEEYLREFNIVTITPKVVDPDYLYVDHRLTVNYRIGSLPEGTDYLKSQIVQAISNYYDTEVEIFNQSFHVSRMLKYVDESHISVLGSKCDIFLIRELINFYKTPMAGVSFMNPIAAKSAYSSEIKYIPGNYDVFIKSTAGTDNGYSGKLLLGPFPNGVITSKPPYAGTDFDKVVVGSRNRYYEIGTIIYETGRMDYDFGELGKPESSYDAAKITIHSTPKRTSIYVNNGSLCVYEYNLRPQYTTINLEAIN